MERGLGIYDGQAAIIHPLYPRRGDRRFTERMEDLIESVNLESSGLRRKLTQSRVFAFRSELERSELPGITVELFDGWDELVKGLE